MSAINSNKVSDLYFNKREEKKLKKINQTLYKRAKQEKESKLVVQGGHKINSKIINFVKY